jgi:hypothetical protein
VNDQGAGPGFRPFSSGFEFMDWHARNCERCTKGPAPDLQGPNEACDIENAFALAAICGGTVNDPCIGEEENARRIAKRLRWDGTGKLPPQCSEFEENNQEEPRRK